MGRRRRRSPPGLMYPHLFPCIFKEPSFTSRRHWKILTTTVSSLSTSTSSSSATPWLYAAVKTHDDGDKPPLLHPLTLKPHDNLAADVNLHNFETTALTSFYHTDFSFDKLVKIDDGILLVLYGGGQLIGRLPCRSNWVKLSWKNFDDIAVVVGNIYAVDIQGKLFSVDVSYRTLGKLVVSQPNIVSSGWHKRLVVDGNQLFLAVCVSRSEFRVYKLIRHHNSGDWVEVRKFDCGKVLFVSKDCCFFVSGFGGREYRNCIVFTESGFGYDRYTTDEIGVFRMSDECYGTPGESVEFPEIDWSPPSWMFDVGSCSVSHAHRLSEGEPDEEDGGVRFVSKESNSEDENDTEIVMLDPNSPDQEQEERFDSEIQSDANIEGVTSLLEDIPPSLLADVSAVEDEVTRTLLRTTGGNEAIKKESSQRNITLSAPRACTSSSNKRHKIDNTTAKFEGFDIRSDAVPTLQKIWRKHGNIIENSTMRSVDIITRALESLATVVQILENNSAQSLSDSEANYISSTVSDLKFMDIKVQWLVSIVEKAVKLHKSKTMVDCLNKLTQLSHQVKDRKDMLLDEAAKLTEEENKLTKEMAKVSKLIPFSGQLNFDEPLGLGLT